MYIKKTKDKFEFMYGGEVIPKEKLSDIVMKCGGKIGKKAKRYAQGGQLETDVPNQNEQPLNEDATLLTNDEGGTDGSHSEGDNIPMDRNGKQVGVAEPGEVIMKLPNGEEYVLSKELGFAQKYMQLEDTKRQLQQLLMDNTMTFDKRNSIKRELDKVKTMEFKLPEQQEQVKASKGIGNSQEEYDKGGWIEAGMSVLPSVIGTFQNMSSINKTPFFPKPIKEQFHPLETNVPVGNQIEDVNKAVNSQARMLDYNTSNSSSLNAGKQYLANRGSEIKSRIFGDKALNELGLRNQNIQNYAGVQARNTANLNAVNTENTKIAAGKEMDKAKAFNTLMDRVSYVKEYKDKLNFQEKQLSLEDRRIALGGAKDYMYNFLRHNNIDGIDKNTADAILSNPDGYLGQYSNNDRTNFLNALRKKYKK